MSASGRTRLMVESKQIAKDPPEFIRARPSERDIFRFHFVLEGPPKTEYASGFYHGLLLFPPEYPLAPPEIRMLTPSGRFEVNTALCMSMSSFHKETWNPVWGVKTILLGVLSFMTGTERTAGSMEASTEQRRAYARQSLDYNCSSCPKKAEFASLFPELAELNAARKAEAYGFAPPGSAGDAGGGGLRSRRAGAGLDVPEDMEGAIAQRQAEEAAKGPKGIPVLAVVLFALAIVALVSLLAWWKRSGGGGGGAAGGAGAGGLLPPR
jgi:ubiquitin-conjugating enzyme E2 J2